MQEWKRVCKSGKEYAIVGKSMQEWERVCKSGKEYARVEKSMQEWERYARVGKVCKSGKSMQEWERYARVGRVCKIEKEYGTIESTQESPTVSRHEQALTQEHSLPVSAQHCI